MAGNVYPILFVGCGGSGGVTLRFTMDSLRAEIARWNSAREASDGPAARIPFGPSGLPDAWQFVHIDVPGSPDGNAVDRPPSVPEQGGRYISLAPAGYEYKTLSDQLWERTRGTGSRHLMTGWMKRPNPATDPVLTAGAGQMRNVGRAVALSSLDRISEGLEGAARRLMSASAAEDLRKLAALTGSQTATSPVVFIVSSMSGGAGASMVLDVARVLTRLRPTWLGLTSLFLYTSEVFSELPENARTGVEGNGLAAMGELLATALGANGQRILVPEDDDELRRAATMEAAFDENRLLADLGFAVGGGSESQTFRRVFPIGNSQGERSALFGDGTMDTVFRAIGRGLAGLVASPTAISDFVQYDMTNPNSRNTDLRWLGEGSLDKQTVLWGTFGFGRLSLGRDRYAEYLSQRIARDAVDRLAGASQGARSSAERDMELAADSAYDALRRDLGLPGTGQPAAVLPLLARGRDPQAARAELAAPIRRILFERIYQHPRVLNSHQAQDYVGALRQVGGDSARPAMAQVQEVGYAAAYEWVQRLSSDVLRAVEGIAARQGLGVARRVVLHLKEDTSHWSRSLQAESRALAPEGVAALPGPPAGRLDEIAKMPTPPANSDLVRQLQNDHATAVTRVAGGVVAGLLSDALSEFGDKFANPLARALQDALGTLEAARARVPLREGIAEARTDVYGEWPSAAGNVATRFRGAHNEVMLIDPDTFPQQVDADLDVIRRARGLATVGEAREAVFQEVLTGRWAGHNDDTNESVTIRTLGPWVPVGMVRDPSRPDLGRVSSAAAFSTDTDPRAVVARSRAWVNRPNGELAPFLRQGIRGYLSESGTGVASRRSAALAGKFAVVLQHAAPLVQVDAPAFALVHPNVKLEEMFKFSGVPLRDLPGGAADGLLSVLRDRGSVAAEAIEGFQSALDEDTGTVHLDVFGSYPPMVPLALPSLLRPLGAALSRVNAAGAVADMWRNRRARPLVGCLPMTPVERRSLVAGYIVGRMTGRLRGVYQQNPYERNEPLAVYSEASATWLRFPAPLLTAHAQGFDSDEVGAILEAYLVAIAQCGFDPTLAPLAPYLALRSLYGSPSNRQGREYDTTFGATRYLTRFIVADERPPEGGPRRAERGAAPGATPQTAQARKEAAVAYLAALDQGVTSAFGGAEPAKSPRIEQMRYDVRPLLNSLAPDVIWATEQLTGIVEGITATDATPEGPSEPVTGVDF